MPRPHLAISAALLGALAVPFGAQAAERANAILMTPEGQEIGKAELAATAEGGVHLIATATGLAPGIHAFHIHETGACDGAGGFESAGGHYNPDDKAHGWKAEGGDHAGDLPNVHVHDDGQMSIEYITDAVTLAEDGAATLFDEDGSALVIHAGPDDYMSQPSGAAGDRIACGVIEAD